MKRAALAEIKDQLSKFLHEAAKEEILITRHGKPAGVLIGFESDDDWFDYKLENDPRFLGRVERARQSLRSGRGIRLEDLAASQSAKAGGDTVERTARSRSRQEGKRSRRSKASP